MENKKYVLEIRTEEDLGHLFPLKEYDDEIVAEGGHGHNYTHIIEDELRDFLISKGIEVEKEDDFDGYYNEPLDYEELVELAESKGYFLYRLGGYSKGDHYEVLSRVELSYDYLEELNSIVFGGNDWFILDLLEVDDKGDIDWVVSINSVYVPFTTNDENTREILRQNIDYMIGLKNVDAFVVVYETFNRYIETALEELGLKEVSYKKSFNF